MPTRNFRTRGRSSSGSEEEENGVETADTTTAGVKSALDTVKEFQELRKRKAGVTVADLAYGDRKKQVVGEKYDAGDPFKLKTGGLVNLSDVLDTGSSSVGNLQSTFSAETNAADDDREMLKFIERELKKRRGGEEEASNNQASEKSTSLRDEWSQLYAVPERLKTSKERREDDSNSSQQLSTQMLQGIPEVDLGLAARIKNIEATEEAKMKLINAAAACDTPPPPSGVAVNFVQHNRWDRPGAGGSLAPHAPQHLLKAKATDKEALDRFRQSELDNKKKRKGKRR